MVENIKNAALKETDKLFSARVRINQPGDTFIISDLMVLRYKKQLRNSGTNPLFYFAAYLPSQNRITTYSTDFKPTGIRRSREIGELHLVDFGNLDPISKSFVLTIKSTKPVKIERVLDPAHPKVILKIARQKVT